MSLSFTLRERFLSLLTFFERSKSSSKLVSLFLAKVRQTRFAKRCRETYSYISQFIENPGLESLLLNLRNAESTEVKPEDILGYWQLNPTLFKSGEKIFLCWRATNGVFSPVADSSGKMKLEKSSPQIRNQILIGELDKNLNLLNQRKIHDSVGVPSFEDPRGFNSNTASFVSGTVVTEEPSNGTGRWRSSVGLLNTSTGEIRIFANPNGKMIEKNWVPVATDETQIKMLYSTNPQVIVEVDKESFEVEFHSRPNVLNVPNLSGGSQFVEIPGGQFLRVARKRLPVEGKGLVHFSYLLIYDSNLNLSKISRPFIFRKVGFEICNGLTLTSDNLLYFSWGEDDRKLYVMRARLSEVLMWIENNDISNLKRKNTKRNLKLTREVLVL
jgi:hypothetical protein